MLRTSIISLPVLLILIAGCSQPNVPRLREKAQVAAELGDHDQAIAYYEEALAVQPEDPKANLGIGRSYLATNQADEARTHLEVAYQHAWSNPDRGYEVAGDLAEAMARDNDPERLFAFLRERAELTTDVRDYLRWGDFAMRFDDADGAVVAYGTALRLSNGQDPDPYVRLADVYAQAGDREAADRRLRQAYGLAPEREDIIERLRQYHDVVGPSLALPPDRPEPTG